MWVSWKRVAKPTVRGPPAVGSHLDGGSGTVARRHFTLRQASYEVALAARRHLVRCGGHHTEVQLYFMTPERWTPHSTLISLPRRHAVPMFVPGAVEFRRRGPADWTNVDKVIDAAGPRHNVPPRCQHTDVGDQQPDLGVWSAERSRGLRHLHERALATARRGHRATRTRASRRTRSGTNRRACSWVSKTGPRRVHRVAQGGVHGVRRWAAPSWVGVVTAGRTIRGHINISPSNSSRTCTPPVRPGTPTLSYRK